MSKKISIEKYQVSVPICKFHATASGVMDITKRKKSNEFVPMEPKFRGIPYEWYVTRGRGTKIALLDTGIDLDHPDLKDGIVAYKDFTGEGIMDQNGHGTFVAGIASARENGVGIVGIAPESEITAVKVMNKYGYGSLDNICDGIDWAVEQGVDIISLSISGHKTSQRLNHSIHTAIAKGVCVIASAGNEGGFAGKVNGFPGGFGSVITVGAHNRDGKLCDFSSVGPHVKMLAPGTGVWSTDKGGGYACKSGSSVAAPFAAGLAALIIAKHKLDPTSKTPILNNQDLLEHMLRMTGHHGYYVQGEGHGLLMPLRFADTSVVMVKDSSITVDMVKDSSITDRRHVVIDGVGYTIFYYNTFQMAA